MTWLAGLTFGMLVVFIVVVARSLRYVPSNRPNYEEKELTATAYDYKPTRRNTRFHIRNNGTVVKQELCQC